MGDFDNDGWPDLYVTNYGKNRLYRQQPRRDIHRRCRRRPVSISICGPRAPLSAITTAMAGSIYSLTATRKSILRIRRYPERRALVNAICQFHGVPVMCGPRGLKGEHDHLFHNNGDGTFTDVSKKLGVDDAAGYYGLGVLFADVNNDGKPDLLVANDSTPNYLYINKGDGTFENQSYPSGYALNGDGREVANMGIAAGDYENNGHLSIVNTDFAE